MTTLLTVPSTGPYGMEVEADKYGHALVVKEWKRLPNGKFGPVQKHGGINLGDIIVAINDINLSNTPHSDALQLLNKTMSNKVLKIVTSRLYYKEKKVGKMGRNATDVKDSGGKSPFQSIINRARVNDFASTKFAEYEVVCQLRVASLSVGKEKTFKWSVWKRFSDFEQLNTALKKTLGWHMDKISFPSSHTFTLSKLSPDFMEQRRCELNEYWQKVIAIDKVTEFNKHHCSSALKTFIDVDGALLGDKTHSENDGVKQSGEGTKDDPKEKEEDSKEGTTTEDSKKGESQRRTSRRLSSRSNSNKSGMRRTSSATSSTTASSSTATSTTTTSSPSTNPPEEKAKTEPNPPTPPPSTTTTASKMPTGPPPSSGSSSLPPPASGARLNLLGSINALRKD